MIEGNKRHIPKTSAGEDPEKQEAEQEKSKRKERKTEGKRSAQAERIPTWLFEPRMFGN